MLLTIAAAVVVLGVLIFVHELGHFWAAKAVGVGVPRFSIGFGAPTPLRWRRGETEYVISWIPFGGYVKMATAEEDPSSSLEGGAAEQEFPPEKLFENKPLWARVLVISAGVTMNALFAWLLYTVIAAAWGRMEDPTTRIAAVDSAGLPPAAAGLASLPAGAQVVRINGDTIASWNELMESLGDPRSDTLRFEFAEGVAPVTVPIAGVEGEARVALATALHPQREPRIGLVMPGRPAARAGIQVGDVVVSVDGRAIGYWDQFVQNIEGRAGDTIALVLRRDSVSVELPVVPEPEEIEVAGEKKTIARIGVAFEAARTRTVRYGPAGAVVEGARRTVDEAGKVWFALTRLIVGRLPLKEIGGPVLIGQMSGVFVRLGLQEYLAFIAFFSINLAILNLLPVPVLDGGHLVFLIAEGIRGKPLSLKFRLRLSQVGMALLIALMVLALSNDIRRLIAP